MLMLKHIYCFPHVKKVVNNNQSWLVYFWPELREDFLLILVVFHSWVYWLKHRFQFVIASYWKHLGSKVPLVELESGVSEDRSMANWVKENCPSVDWQLWKLGFKHGTDYFFFTTADLEAVVVGHAQVDQVGHGTQLSEQRQAHACSHAFGCKQAELHTNRSWQE